MNTSELLQAESYYKYHPQAVELTVVSTGLTCNGLFDYSFQPGGTDKAGVQQMKKLAHFVCYVGNESLFSAGRGTAVTINSTSYTIVTVEKLDEIGAVQLWLV